MHLLKHSKKVAPKPLVPILSHFKIPFHRKLRGKRYNAKGEMIGECGPLRRPDPVARAALLRARREAALMPKPEETEGFDLKRFRPLPRKVLCKRPPQITEIKGVTLPEKQWQSEDWFWVVSVGAGVTVCQAGDRVVFGRKSKPKPVRIGQPFHLGRATAIAALVEP